MVNHYHLVGQLEGQAAHGDLGVVVVPGHYPVGFLQSVLQVAAMLDDALGVVVGYPVGFLQSVVEALGVVVVGCTVGVAELAIVHNL